MKIRRSSRRSKGSSRVRNKTSARKTSYQRDKIIIAALLIFSIAFFGYAGYTNNLYTTGLATGTTCTDSDGGISYNVKGTATASGRSYTDVCLNSTRVKEYYCSSSTSTSASNIQYNCQYGCSGGKCNTSPSNVTIRCKDSDGGKIYNTFGYVSVGGRNYTDVCINSTRIKEYYCYSSTSTSASNTQYNCQYGCQNGACVQETITCTDSDGGKNYYVKGYLKDPYSSAFPNGTIPDSCGIKNSYGNYDFTYSCQGTDCFVFDYYCVSDSNDDVSMYNCPNGCQNGACVQETITCTDTDGGKNYNVKGTVTDFGSGPAPMSDICTGNTLREYFCTGNGFSSELYNCPYGCTNGACVTVTTTCTDSDGGKNYYVKGTVDSGPAPATDICTGNTLREYFCTGNGFSSELYNCPNGCQNGACISGNVSYQCTSGACCDIATGYFKPSSTICAAASGICENSAYCTGSSVTCPAKFYKHSATVCAAASGICENSAYCTGASANCPMKTYRPSSTMCQPASGPYENDAYCTGFSAACPANTSCPASLGTCDATTSCDARNCGGVDYYCRSVEGGSYQWFTGMEFSDRYPCPGSCGTTARCAGITVRCAYAYTASGYQWNWYNTAGINLQYDPYNCGALCNTCISGQCNNGQCI